ncbi:DUF4040 family protein [Ruania suaedae]|uniref:DUF4040 family protein n=1 Tax=Ruania suaedae TaxID=2897774 RepID=UPI001E6021AD|nr:DUF4040 family protein [Ruania suaedae]UFU02949.1 DUF4040 family protein [Ruania suaedae]
MLLTCVAIAAGTCAAAPFLTRAVGRRAGWILALPLLVAAALIVGTSDLGTPVAQEIPWIPQLGVDLALRLDGLSLAFALLVLVIGAAVLFYSARYLGDKSKHHSFYGWMTAFAAAMLVLVLSDNLVLLFVAWEGTTLCSFFLIGRSGPAGREPAIRTLLVTASGGLSLLAAVAVMAVGTGTTRISEVLTSTAWQEGGFTTAVAVLLAVAAFTKSAQFPFQSWLPESMVAITPVSAYLHAAAMVKAGIYLLLRFSPALAEVPIWTILLVTSGLITALLGAAAALRRHDLKELLAYSTISQLGLLVTMIGVGTPDALKAAVVHTLAHALFKSALFMYIGVIDKQAGTRDIRELASLRLRMPVTVVAIGLAAASMAGVPLLLGFISKESMFTAFVEAPGVWVPLLATAGAAVASVLTFAYSGRIVLGAFSGRTGEVVREASTPFWIAPALAAAAGLVLGVVPAVLDPLVSSAATAVVGSQVETHLAIWHGVNLPLGISVAILTLGTVLVLTRARVERFTAPLAIPISAPAIVDAIRAGIIRTGTVVGSWTGSTSPRRHLIIPVVCVTLIAAVASTRIDSLPPVVGNPTRVEDWALVALVAVGVVATLRARTRISAIVVIGVVGFAMTLWFFVLGAPDVALTQLLVEILTVTVMVLLLRRLPDRFATPSARGRLPKVLIALGAGGATTLGVWALTGRREMSEAATYYLGQAEEATGGANIVNTILVDFRALDTLGELTVLGVAGVAIAALLTSRRAAPTRSAKLAKDSPLADARDNAVFAGTAAKVLAPLVVLVSLMLLLRGHQEPGGGFIAALVGGAGFALLYLAAPSDVAARIRWPYLTLIGLGVVVGTGTGLLGYIDGSFLTPLHPEVLGIKLTTALVFDIGVYLAVVGIVLTAFNLLGRQHRIVHRDREDAEQPADPSARETR